MRFHSALLLLLLFFLRTCDDASQSVKHIGMEGNLARFEISNRTGIDFSTVELELTYLGDRRTVLRIDTVAYTATGPDGESIPFLKAKETTMIVQAAPDGTTSAKGRVLAAR